MKMHMRRCRCGEIVILHPPAMTTIVIGQAWSASLGDDEEINGTRDSAIFVVWLVNFGWSDLMLCTISQFQYLSILSGG